MIIIIFWAALTYKTFNWVFDHTTSTVITCHVVVLHEINYAFPLLKQAVLIFGNGISEISVICRFYVWQACIQSTVTNFTEVRLNFTTWSEKTNCTSRLLYIYMYIGTIFPCPEHSNHNNSVAALPCWASSIIYQYLHCWFIHLHCTPWVTNSSVIANCMSALKFLLSSTFFCIPPACPFYFFSCLCRLSLIFHCLILHYFTWL